MTVALHSGSMNKALLGLYTYFEFFALALVFLPIMGLVALFAKADPGRRHRGQWMRRFGRTTIRLTPLWRFSVEGPKPADIDTKPYVVVSNHLSTSDPFLLSWLPWDMRWVAKQELFRQPVTGWLIGLGGDIPLRRGHRSSVAQMFEACHETLKAGVSVMLFPEGTRSDSGEILPFKKGPFALAVKAGVQVIPVTVEGTRHIMPKNSWNVIYAAAPVKVMIGKPIDPAPFGEDREALMRAVRDVIIDQSVALGGPGGNKADAIAARTDRDPKATEGKGSVTA